MKEKTKDTAKKDIETNSEFEKFRNFTKKIINTPKNEIDELEKKQSKKLQTEKSGSVQNSVSIQ